LKNILYISAFLPYKNSPHGGGHSAYQNILALKKNPRNHVNVIVCTTEKFKPSKALQIVSQNHLSLICGWIHDILGFRFKGFFLWPIVHTRANIRLYKAINNELNSNTYDYIYVDFTQMFLPVFNALKSRKMTTNIILCISDLYIQKFIRKNDFFSRFFMAKVANYERFIFSHCKKVIVLNDKDALLINYLYDIYHLEVKTYVAPLWVKKVSRSNIKKNECIFFGNFRRQENLEALEWFASNILHQVLKKHPLFKLHLIGEINFKIEFLNKFRKSIQCHGFLADPSAVFSRSSFTIAPLKHGAGIKYKVLDSLAANVPVIGTSVAFEGIKKNTKMYLSEREDFLQSILKLLR